MVIYTSGKTSKAYRVHNLIVEKVVISPPEKKIKVQRLSAI